MPIRTLSLPGDLEPLGEMVGQAFQYPNHPEWSVQSDEVESISSSMKNYRRHLDLTIPIRSRNPLALERSSLLR